MTIREKEDLLFSELSVVNPDIITDGVVDEAEYLDARYKIVYILKEVNGGKGWDLREFLRDGGRPQTWDNIARWTEAILNLDKPRDWTYWESNSEDRRNTYLKKLCAINLKKTSGGHTSNGRDIATAAAQYQDVLKKQLVILTLIIIICCGTEQAYFEYLYESKNPEWRMTSRGVWYVADSRRIIISFAHPEARTKVASYIMP
jgi:hypothetical protein